MRVVGCVVSGDEGCALVVDAGAPPLPPPCFPRQRAERTLKFTTEKVIGNGSFGVVYEARIIETGETVAIKKVLQDRRFKVGVWCTHGGAFGEGRRACGPAAPVAHRKGLCVWGA